MRHRGRRDAARSGGRIRALEQGTSVNAVLREFLESYAGASVESAARSRLADLARASTASSGPGGRRWTRDEVYDRRFDSAEPLDAVHEP